MNDGEQNNPKSGAQIPKDISRRILQLATCMSVVDIAKRPGMPDASTIYREAEADPEFGRAFKRASLEYWQSLREEIAEHIARARQPDPTIIFVALKKLRQSERNKSTSTYDLELLATDELRQLDALLLKATPPHLRPPE